MDLNALLSEEIETIFFAMTSRCSLLYIVVIFLKQNRTMSIFFLGTHFLAHIPYYPGPGISRYFEEVTVVKNVKLSEISRDFEKKKLK